MTDPWVESRIHIIPSSLTLKENLERFFDTLKLRKFPKISYIIVTCSLFEHLSETGLLGLMPIYFQALFDLEPSEVTVALHLYNFLKYFAVVFGAVLADSYYGRVNSIIIGQIIFFLGNTLLTISSILLMDFPSRFVLVLALLAKVIGPGFMLPCIVPLAADQISQTNTTYTEMKAFFVFYFALLQHALRMKIKYRKTEKKDHWLHYASDKYDMKFIEDIRCTINVLFVPIPFYWSLCDQQYTSWTLQAARLNTQVSSEFRIMPEQTQAFGPILFLLFIPIFHFFIYDMLYPFRFLRTLLRRMVTGGFIIAIAFLMASCLELRIEFSYAHLPASDMAYVYIFNGINSGIFIQIENHEILIPPYGHCHQTLRISQDDSQFTAEINYNNKKISANFVAKRRKAVSYAVVGPEPIEFLKIGKENFDVNKHYNGLVKQRIICVDKIYCKNINLRFYPNTWYIQRPITAKITNVQEPSEMNMHSGVYEVYADLDSTKISKTVDLGTGGVYSMMVYRNDNETAIKQFVITPPNEISVLWMLPQYIVLSVSMVLFRISAFAFIYTETPDQMKSLAWSMCYMTLSTGNIITAIFGGTGRPSTSFLIFGLGMILGMFLFMESAASFKYTHKYPEWLKNRY